MPPPDPSFLASIPPGAWIEGVGVDHPALAHRLAESWGVSPRQVLLQPGSHWNLLLATAARLAHRPGPVVVEQPAYEPLRRIPVALGAEVLRLPRRRSRGRGIDPRDLDRLASHDPSLLLLSQPHNPSMAVLDASDRQRLAAWSRETGCAILSDEVYLEFLEDFPAHSLHSVLPEAAIIRSFTKVMGLGSIRTSALVAPMPWIAAAAALSDYGPVFLPMPSQAVAAAAWRQRERLWQRARRLSAARRETVARWARRVEGLLDLELGEAGIIGFAHLHEEAARKAAATARRRGVETPFGFSLDGAPDASIWWIEDLRRREGVLVTPGGFFEEPRGFRLGFGVEAEILEEGLDRLAGYLEQAVGQGA